MSTTLQEGELQIDLPSSARGRKFDDQTHGLSHCGLKAVDWIIELQDRTYFVELKDLDAAGASRHRQRSEYLEDLETGGKDHALARKFRDTFIYQWASEQVGKPIIYLVVIACHTLDRTMLLNRTEALRRILPSGVQPVWKQAIAEDVLVLNERTWNEQFRNFPMERVSA